QAAPDAGRGPASGTAAPAADQDDVNSPAVPPANAPAVAPQLIPDEVRRATDNYFADESWQFLVSDDGDDRAGTAPVCTGSPRAGLRSAGARGVALNGCRARAAARRDDERRQKPGLRIG